MQQLATLYALLLSLSAISKGLLVVSIEPKGREVTFVEHYTSAQLMTLPPLFLAACRGRCTPVTLLLQHGAKPNITVSWLAVQIHTFPFFLLTCYFFKAKAVETTLI